VCVVTAGREREDGADRSIVDRARREQAMRFRSGGALL